MRNQYDQELRRRVTGRGREVGVISVCESYAIEDHVWDGWSYQRMPSATMVVQEEGVHGMHQVRGGVIVNR